MCTAGYGHKWRADLVVQGFCFQVLPHKAVRFCQVVAGCGYMRVPLSKTCSGLLEGSCQVLGSFLMLPLQYYRGFRVSGFSLKWHKLGKKVSWELWMGVEPV